MKECPLCGGCWPDLQSVCPNDRAQLAAVFAGPPVLDRKYRLVDRIGAGGMGAVYRARHLGLERTVAVKLLHPRREADPDAQERFRREARALSLLDHPNVVRVLDFGIDGDSGTPYLVMEPLAAHTLAEHLRRSGPLPAAAALPLLEQVAAALDHAHGQGILHRDLKAGNVLLVETPGGEPRAKLVDFGLASFLDQQESTPTLPLPGASSSDTPPAPGLASGALVGTPSALAPELWQGAPPSAASDLWALGVLAFQTITGRLPFPGPDAAAVEAQLPAGAPRPSRVRPGIDPRLDAALLAPLRTDPGARPASARAVTDGLARALTTIAAARWRRREVPRRAGLALLLGGLAAAALAPFAPSLEPLENRLVDLRFLASPPRSPSAPLLLVAIDDATLAADPTPLPDKGDQVGALLERAFRAGARGVAIDPQFPAWGQSPAFADLVLRHADAVVLAVQYPQGGPAVGGDVATGLIAVALGPERARALFGFVDVDPDADGVVRRVLALARDTAGDLRPSFAARVARLLAPGLALSEGEVSIDATVDPRRFARLSLRDLGDALDRHPERFRGRLVLVGADYAASGERFAVPHPAGLPAVISGPALHGLIAQTLLDGSPVRPPSRPFVLAALALAGALAAAGVLVGGRALTALAFALPALGWTGAGCALFALRRLLVPLAAPVALLLAVALLAALLLKGLPARPRSS